MKRRNGKLSEDAKRFVVGELACFETPSTVAQAVKERFGITVTSQTIEFYDPTKRAGRRISKPWRQLFEETRRSFLAEAATIPIVHRSVRLRKLDRMISQAEAAQNYILAAQLLEQAAKEVGNYFTNARVVSGPRNGPIHVRTTSTITSDMTALEAQAAWEQTMRELDEECGINHYRR